MIPTRYNKPIGQQIEALQEAMDLLQAFAEKHPDLQPFCLYPGIPGCSFPSDALEQLRDAFGAKDWIVTGTVIRKEVDGVLVEAHLPQNEPKPFTL